MKIWEVGNSVERENYKGAWKVSWDYVNGQFPRCPGFASRHPHDPAHNCLGLQLRDPTPSSGILGNVCIHMYVHTHIIKN